MSQVAFASRLCKRFSIDCFVKTLNCLENLPRHLPHDKINKVVCTPSEDSDQVWASAVRTKKALFLIYPLSAQRRLWSDWADAQAEPSLRWAHSYFLGFVMRRLIFFCRNWRYEKFCVPSFKLLSSCSFTSVAVTLCITASVKSWAEQTVPFLVEY